MLIYTLPILLFMKETPEEIYVSPQKLVQINTVKTLFRAVKLDEKDRSDGNMAYQKTVEHLCSLLFKYMPKKVRDEIFKLYEDLDNKKEEIYKSSLDRKNRDLNVALAGLPIADKVLHLCILTLSSTSIVEEQIDVYLKESMDRSDIKEKIRKSQIHDIFGRNNEENNSEDYE
jgi:hypothetical protein